MLNPCFWYSLLCGKCGQCYAGLVHESNHIACPECHATLEAQFVCKGMTTAPLPTFSPMHRWTSVHGARGIEDYDWVGNGAKGISGYGRDYRIGKSANWV